MQIQPSADQKITIPGTSLILRRGGRNMYAGGGGRVLILRAPPSGTRRPQFAMVAHAFLGLCFLAHWACASLAPPKERKAGPPTSPHHEGLAHAGFDSEGSALRHPPKGHVPLETRRKRIVRVTFLSFASFLQEKKRGFGGGAHNVPPALLRAPWRRVTREGTLLAAWNAKNPAHSCGVLCVGFRRLPTLPAAAQWSRRVAAKAAAFRSLACRACASLLPALRALGCGVLTNQVRARREARPPALLRAPWRRVTREGTLLAAWNAKNPAHSCGVLCVGFRRLPTLPGRCQPSTIGV